MKIRAATLRAVGLPAPFAQSRPLAIETLDLTPPGQDEVLGTNNLGTLVGRPPIEIARPGPEEILGTNNLGAILGRPIILE